MKAIQTLSILPFLLLGACASREATLPSPDSPAADQAPAHISSVPAGAVLRVRLEQTLDTARNRSGSPFFATLTNPIEVEGATAIPAGTRFSGHLVESKPSGRFKGRAVLSLQLDSFELNGHHYAVDASRAARSSKGHKKRNWLLIGGGSGFGATVGAIAGGGEAALIGAGAGAAAGVTGAAFTGKKNVHLPSETQLAFTLKSPITVEPE